MHDSVMRSMRSRNGRTAWFLCKIISPLCLQRHNWNKSSSAAILYTLLEKTNLGLMWQKCAKNANEVGSPYLVRLLIFAGWSKLIYHTILKRSFRISISFWVTILELLELYNFLNVWNSKKCLQSSWSRICHVYWTLLYKRSNHPHPKLSSCASIFECILSLARGNVTNSEHC